jgi:hypothetical protein
MPNTFRPATNREWVHRAELLSEAYIPHLREEGHPMGSVVAINLATAEYVVGARAPQAMHLYAQRFGKDAEPDMYIERRPVVERGGVTAVVEAAQVYRMIKFSAS